MKSFFVRRNIIVYWTIVDYDSLNPFDFTGKKVEVEMYSSSTRKTIDFSETALEGRITIDVESESLMPGVYSLICRYEDENGKGIVRYKNAFQITSREFLTEAENVLELKSYAYTDNEEGTDDPGLTEGILHNKAEGQGRDIFYSDEGTIEGFVEEEDGTYTIKIKRKWEYDTTPFETGDILYGKAEDINAAGKIYESWLRVVNVDKPENKISAVLYRDEQVPGNKNNKPMKLMKLVRRGNAIDKERDGYSFISKNDERFLTLKGVGKPGIEDVNIDIAFGKIEDIPMFKDLPILEGRQHFYARSAIIQNLYRIDFEGTVIQELRDRGPWSKEVATSQNPYVNIQEYADSVWHYGCRWKCLFTGTEQEPQYASTDWAMIEGNPYFTISIESSNGWEFDEQIAVPDRLGKYSVFTHLTVSGMLYNKDVTEFIKNADIVWERDSGNAEEDAIWNIKKSEYGKSLPLTFEDLGTGIENRHYCKFKATALLRDGKETREGSDFVII